LRIIGFLSGLFVADVQYNPVPVDLPAQTRFVKERAAIAELEQIARLADPIFDSPRGVTLNLWLAEREIVNAYIAMKSAWWP